MTAKLSGGCLCGNVEFSLEDNFSAFYQCHCQQCRHLTGSAFASNLITTAGNIEWVKGADRIINYEHPSRDFAKSFCASCGSAVPFINKSKSALIVPAGSLNATPALQPQANIFTAEEACWLKPGQGAQEFVGFPE
jgi:hypothetical protein